MDGVSSPDDMNSMDTPFPNVFIKYITPATITRRARADAPTIINIVLELDSTNSILSASKNYFLNKKVRIETNKSNGGRI